MKTIHLLSSEWWSPHKETDLELIQNSLENSNQVIIIGCNGKLDSCFINPDHSWLKCLQCVGIQNTCKKHINGNVKYLNLLGDKICNKKKWKLFSLPNNIKDFLEIKDGNLEIGYAVGTYLVDVSRDSSINPQNHSKLVHDLLQATSDSYRWFLDLFIKEKPDLVFAMNGRHLQYRAILQAAIDMKIDIKMHDRGGTRNKYMLYPNCLPHDREFFKNLTEITKKKLSNEMIDCEGNRFYTNKIAAKDNNWFSYVSDQEVSMLPDNFEKYSKKVAVFLCSDFECAAVSKEWDWYVYPDQVTGLEKICSEMERINPDMHFFIRLHPNMKNDKATDKILSLGNRLINATFIAPDSPVSSYGLMMNSDIVLTFGSTMGIEACYWGKPSVLICPAMYEDFDVAVNCHSHTDVINALLEPGKPKSKQSALLYGAIQATMGFDFKYVNMETPFKGTFKGNKITFVSGFFRKGILKLANLFSRIRFC